MPDGEDDGPLVSRQIFGLLLIAQQNVMLRRFAGPMLFECEAALEAAEIARDMMKRNLPTDPPRILSALQSVDEHLTKLRQQIGFSYQMRMQDLTGGGQECADGILKERKRIVDWLNKRLPNAAELGLA